jgi:PAS domain S-box-containing protein
MAGTAPNGIYPAIELEEYRKDGSTIWVELSFSFQKNQNQQPTGIVTVTREITARKLDENKLLESEFKYRGLVENSPDAITIYVDGKVVFVNNACLDLLGATKAEELIGKPVLQFVHPDDREFVIARMKKAAEETGTLPLIEEKFLRLDGSELMVEVTGLPLKYEGKPAVQLIIRNITQRKQREKEYKQLIDGMNDTAFVINFDGKFVEVNTTAVEILGYSRDEFLGMSVFDLDPRLAEKEIMGLIERMKSGERQVFETQHQTKNGKIIPVEVSSSPVFFHGKAAILSVARDITERKHAEEMFQDIIDKNPMSIQIVDINGYTIKVNPAHTALFGAVPPAGFSIFDDLQSKSPELKKLIDLAKQGEIVHFPDYYYNVHDISDELPDNPLWIHAILFPLKDTAGKFDRVVLMHENITGRKQAEAALRESEQKYRVLVDNAFEGIVIINLEGNILFANNSILKTFEYENIDGILGQNIFNYIAPEYIAQTIEDFTKVIQGNVTEVAQSCGITSKGKRIWMESIGKIIDYEGTKADMISIRDITAKKEFEEKLRESELKYRLIAENTSDGILIIGADTKIRYVSPSYLKLLGTSEAEELTKNSDDIYLLVHPDDRDVVFAEIFKAIELKKTGLIYTFRVKNKAGHYIWREDHARFIYDEKGNHLETYIICRDITERKQAVVKLQESEARSHRQREALAKLAVDESLLKIDLNEGFDKITRILSETIEVDIAGIWLFSEDEKNLDCIALFEDGATKNPAGHTLVIETLPVYFNAIRTESRIYASDVQNDHRTIELKESYLIPKGITSMLDAGILIKGKLAGVVCLEHKGEKRTWEADEEAFASTVASIISQAMINSERMKTKELLRESEQKFREVFNSTNEAIFIDDALTGIMIDCNERTIEMYGYENKEEILKGNIGDISANVDPYNQARAQYHIQQTINVGPQTFDWLAKRKNGDIFWTEVSLKTSKIGGENRVLAVVRDISDRKHAEQEIIKAKERAEENEVKFKAAFYTSPDSININKLDGEYVEINEGFTRLSGYSNEDVIGKKSLEIEIWAIPEDRARLVKGLKEHGIVENLETMFRTKDGSLIPALMSAQIIRFNNESFILSVTREISERKKFEQELILAKEKAEESDRLKSAFLANMSHEIRTPMNGILGFAGLLKEPELTGEEQKQYIAVIEKSGERMLNIINDIIDISKIEAGQVTVERSDTDIHELSEFLRNFFAPEIKKKGLTLTCNFPKTENHLIVSTDREKLYAILTNLVKNAIKYTPKGNIEFGYEIVGVTGRLPLQFYVKDTGIGIPKDRQQAIFDRFVQADIEDIKAMEGAGLGLAISKAYAEMIGGNIWVESEPEKGSTFWLTIPLQQRAAVTPAKVVAGSPEKESPQTLNDLTVLIAEDEATSDLFLTHILKATFRNILHATTGTETVETIRKNPNIDLILMDIKMPLMNGYEATKIIRSFNKDVVIIAQTAYALSGDREKALEAGCNDYIAKPIKKDLLFSILRHYLTKKTNE